MSISKPKAYVPDMFKGRDIVYVTTSTTWHGGKEFIGRVEAAVLVDGRYYDEEGGRFVMGEGHWELVE